MVSPLQMSPRPKGLAQVTPSWWWGGRLSNPGVPGPGHRPFPRQGLLGRGAWSPWPAAGCLLSRQRHDSGGLFPGGDTEAACSPGGPGHSQYCLHRGVGCWRRSLRHHACHLSRSPLLGDTSHPSRPIPQAGPLERQGWHLEEEPQDRGWGGRGAPTLVRKAARGLTAVCP